MDSIFDHPPKVKNKSKKSGIKSSARKRITPEMAASYLDAVKRGDMKTAQKMVDEAANNAMPYSILREGYAITKGEEDDIINFARGEVLVDILVNNIQQKL